jgi:hypothetical protein
MAQTNEPLPGQAGLANTSLLSGFDNREISPNPHEKQAAITALRRDFVAEALRVVAIKAAHAAEDIELGDDVCAERGLGIVIAHVKEAAKTFREMRREVGQ